MDAAGAIVYSNVAYFGGIYLTHVDDLELNVTVVKGAPRQLIQAVTDSVPADVTVKWHTVGHSLADLRAVRDEIEGLDREFSTLGAPFVSTGILPDRNIVILTVARGADVARPVLESKYGDMIEVVEGPYAVPDCSSRTNCTPWRGGILLQPVGCTYAFNAKRVSNGNLVMLTAGHCGNRTWSHNGVVIGTTNLNNLETSNRELGDFQRVSAAGLTTPRNLVYRSDSNKSWSITSRRQYSFQYQYDPVLKSGASYGLRQGQITDPEHRYWYDHHGDLFRIWGKRASYRRGDSGAPVFWGNSAYGIHSAAYSTYDSVYGTADYAETALGVRLCFTSSC